MQPLEPSTEWKRTDIRSDPGFEHDDRIIMKAVVRHSASRVLNTSR